MMTACVGWAASIALFVYSLSNLASYCLRAHLSSGSEDGP
jgi:hypothetical protein